MTTKIIRENELYVSWQTHKSIQYIAGARGIPPDELAEQVLAEWVKNGYPDVVAHIKSRFEQDKAFKTELAKALNPGVNLP